MPITDVSEFVKDDFISRSFIQLCMVPFVGYDILMYILMFKPYIKS